VITFDYSEAAVAEIDAEIFISIDRVKENAKNYNESFERELYRIIIHGLLHLLGYDDKSVDKREVMQCMEEKYLKCLE
jgi:rRNA maturation RNase YbeY